jgi:hypothetical protein
VINDSTELPDLIEELKAPLPLGVPRSRSTSKTKTCAIISWQVSAADM